MRLVGSCHCQRVRFSIESAHPYPFNLCYCGICRKIAGSGGFGINLGGEAASLQIEGAEHINVYRALVEDEASGKRTESPAERRFCRHCGSALWVWDPRWPNLIHPYAGAIDTPLPTPPERVHLMLDSKSSWVEPAIGPGDQQYSEYPRESIADWHANRHLER